MKCKYHAISYVVEIIEVKLREGIKEDRKLTLFA